MFRSSKKKQPIKKVAPTIIASDMSILGNLFSEGAVDIDGRIEGNVKARTVIVRQNGCIIGDLQADVAQVYGQVKGLIKARDVQLFSSCGVEGTIMHESLSIEDGAFVDGKFKRTDKVALLEDQRPVLAYDKDQEEAELEEPIDLLENIRLISSNEH